MTNASSLLRSLPTLTAREEQLIDLLTADIVETGMGTVAWIAGADQDALADWVFAEYDRRTYRTNIHARVWNEVSDRLEPALAAAEGAFQRRITEAKAHPGY